METNVKAIELRDLWRRFKGTGDVHARERLVIAYSPLVKYVAGRMASGLPAHVEEADLISYGLVGLINAIERFEVEREIKFETYAITRIKGSIIDELRSLDWVPRSVRARAREIERANAKLEHQLQRAPSDEEMAAELKMGVDEFQDALVQISNSTIAALDELWSVSDSSGDAVSLLDTLTDESAPDPAAVMDQTDLKDRVADAIARLPEREKLVVALYYYENLTLREIGEVLGVTQSRVSQLHTKAVLRLRAASPTDDAPTARRTPRRHRGHPRDSLQDPRRVSRTLRTWAAPLSSRARFRRVASPTSTATSGSTTLGPIGTRRSLAGQLRSTSCSGAICCAITSRPARSS